MAKLKKYKKEKNKGRKMVFIPIIISILIVVAVTYFGKYIYNKYLELEEQNNTVKEEEQQVEIYIYN